MFPKILHNVRILFWSPQQQIVQYLKDMFDHDKVRFSTVSSLAEDILSLSHRRADILVGYLGIDSLPETNGAVPKSPCQDNSEHPDVSEQHMWSYGLWISSNNKLPLTNQCDYVNVNMLLLLRFIRYLEI